MVTRKDLYVGLEFEYIPRPEKSKYKITHLGKDSVDFVCTYDNYRYNYIYKQFLNLLNSNYKIIKPKQKTYSIW